MQVNLRDTVSLRGLGRSRREGHGNPLQYSCLENPMDRGALWATLHGVGKSQIRLKWLSTYVHTHTKIRETDVWHVARLPEWIHYFLLDPELSSRTTIFRRPNCPGPPAFSCIYAFVITTTLFLHTHAITRSSMRESLFLGLKVLA